MRVLPDGSLVEMNDETDEAALAAMTDEEVEANALSDPDSGWESDEELDQERPVPFARIVRASSGLTQEAFAERFHIPLGTLRDWEQGVSQPEAAAQTLLVVIRYHPEAVVESLGLLLQSVRKANAA
jgi:putative transcriptional regulator